MSIRLQDLKHDCINHIGKFLNQDDVDVLIGIGLKAKCYQIVDALRIDYKHRQSTEWNQSLNKYNKLKELISKYNKFSVGDSVDNTFIQFEDILDWAISTCDMRIINEFNIIRKDMMLYHFFYIMPKSKNLCYERNYHINTCIENIQSAIKWKYWLMVILYIYYTNYYFDLEFHDNKLYYHIYYWTSNTSSKACDIEIEFDNYSINSTLDIYKRHNIIHISKYISNINIKLSKKIE